MDLDLFDLDRDHRKRSGSRRPDRGRRHRDDDGDDDGDDDRDDDRDDDDDQPRRRSARGGGGLWNRRAHPHMFSWLLLAGGAVLFGLVALAVASSLGLWGPLADAYFAVTTAILPASWHDEWRALPAVAHIAMVLGALFVAVGIAGEVFD